MKYLLLLITVYCLTSCVTHEKEGMLVRDAYGHIYRLAGGREDESYLLIEEDTAQLKNIQNER